MNSPPLTTDDVEVEMHQSPSFGIRSNHKLQCYIGVAPGHVKETKPCCGSGHIHHAEEAVPGSDFP